ncbi:MAG: protein-tyrosine phosphatase family protein [archaeon]
MDDHRFAPAAPDEEIVHGAVAPGFATRRPDDDDPVAPWIEAMQARGIERVCCLLTDRQRQRYDGLLDRYRTAFGDDSVCHAPIEDHTLADPETVTDRILPFFAEGDAAFEPVVAHCLAGIGRTGHVLAAWLVGGRGVDPGEAVRVVSQSGRDPREAIAAGNATDADLDALLAAAREW